MMKNQKGITLIALVITIIVLLILAGVSIAMLTGENGILTKAGQAGDNSQLGEVADRINMALNGVFTDLTADRIDVTEIESHFDAATILRINGLSSPINDVTYNITFANGTAEDDSTVVTMTATKGGSEIKKGTIVWNSTDKKYDTVPATYPTATTTTP